MRLRLFALITLIGSTSAIAAPNAATAPSIPPAIQQSATAVPKSAPSLLAPLVQLATDPAHPAYTVDETPEKGFWDRLFDDPNSFLIMLFTVVLGVAAIWQGRILSRQDERLVESLDATRAANDLAKDSAERQLRAYLSVEDLPESKSPYHIQQEHRFESESQRRLYVINVNALVVNRGVTPAYNVSYFFDYYWYKEGEGSSSFRRHDPRNPTGRFMKICGVLNQDVDVLVQCKRAFVVEYKSSGTTQFTNNAGTQIRGRKELVPNFVFELPEEEDGSLLMLRATVSYVDTFKKRRYITIKHVYVPSSREISMHVRGVMSS